MGYSAKTPRVIFPVKRPLYYYITDRKQLSGGSLESSVRRAVEWGVDFIQIREKDLSDRELWRLATKVVEMAGKSGCKILVNGRPDLALSAGAQGVHLPSGLLTPADIRPWVPDCFIIGISVHSRAEGIRAASEGADYLLLGPIFATPSKTSYGAPLGLPAFRRACNDIALPVLGLGGIDSGKIRAVCEAGAAGVAGIRMFQMDLSSLPRLSLRY